MDSSTFLWFFVIVVAVPVLSGVIGSIVLRGIKLEEKRVEAAAREGGTLAVETAARIERLEARIAVLERIAVDRNEGLTAQIDGLRDAPKLN